MSRQILGVLTARNDESFFENTYFRHLIKEGRRLGLTIYLFSNEDVDWKKRMILGTATGPDGQWQTSMYPWPDIVIERRRSRWTPGYRRLRKSKAMTYANNPFTLKSRYTQLFSQTKEVKKWIPKTVDYLPLNLRRMLNQFPIVYVKPGNGTAGHSVVQIKRNNGFFKINGRQRSASLQSVQQQDAQATVSWLNRWVKTESIRSGSFMIQQGLNLELIPDRVVDSRLLIQKGGDGIWNVTGMAVRVGGKQSPTTNLLYGDGKAYPFRTFMEKRFGKEKAAQIERECVQLAHAVVQTVENRFGSMMEFGLDIGIDVNGRVWLIEANPKPSRDVFLKCGQPNIYWNAVRNPLRYAKYLMKTSTARKELSEQPKSNATETKETPNTAPESLVPESITTVGKSLESIAPKRKAPRTKTPDRIAPDNNAPEASERKAPERKAPERTAPETKAPKTKAPADKTTENRAAESSVPVKKAPRRKAPAINASESVVLESRAPESKGPKSQAAGSKPARGRKTKPV